MQNIKFVWGKMTTADTKSTRGDDENDKVKMDTAAVKGNNKEICFEKQCVDIFFDQPRCT